MRSENALIAGSTDALWTSSKTQDKTMLMAESIAPASLDDPKSAVNKSPDVVTDDEEASDPEELELIEVEDEEEVEEVFEADGRNEDATGGVPAVDDQGEDVEYVYEDEDNEVNDEEEEIIEDVLTDEDEAPENVVEDDSSEYSGDDMGGDSTHVAISGLEQSGVERVDLEKLKPKSPERASPKPSLSSLEREVSEEASMSLVHSMQAAAEEEELPTTPIVSGSKSTAQALSAPERQDPPAPTVFARQVDTSAPASPSHPKVPPSYSSLPVEPQMLEKATAEVQADAAVGPESPLAWEKPAWTKPRLRSTPAGDAVKQGATLASPITHIRKTVNAASMMNGFVGSPLASPKRHPHPASSPPLSGGKNLDWEKPTWVAAKLRPTEQGVLVKTKGDLQQPITNVEKNGIDSINVEANPMGLRPTDRGNQVRLGATLAAPITHFGKSPMADVNFEANPDLILHSTELGDVVKQGSSLAAPVTQVNQEKSAARDVNPVANPTVLRKTELGDVVKTVGDLQAPITHVERDRLKDINLEANPMVLKPTDKGCKIRLGDDLSGPITTIASKKNPLSDVNFEANPDLILQPTPLGRVVKRGNSLAKPVTHVNVEKDAARDVNFVANPALLRRTDLGAIVKTKGDLQKPITHVEKDSLDDINFEANPMILRPTTKGCLLRIGEDLARPITHIARNRSAEIDEFLGHSNSSGVQGSDREDDDRLSQGDPSETAD